MDPRPSSKSPSAEALFADYLDRLEAGETVDFAAFCGAHPEQAQALQRVHTRWQAMTRAFTQLSLEGQADDAAVASKTVDDLKQRLGTPSGRLARYTLRAEIARGAMGRIVHAWDEELRRDVALKIHRGAIGDTRTQRRFLEEAQIAGQLDHPGIVPIHELGVDDEGRPFFAMQLVRGRDLGQLLVAVAEQRDGWSRTRALGVLLRVCEAMAFAHDKGVVHRDLKPANIMVGRFGETYVMDWGLAHVQRHGGDEATAAALDEPVDTLRADIADADIDSRLLTRHGDVLGTPAYMAPEQAAGGSHAAPAVDVYSLGAILYHLLVGAMPYAVGPRNADEVLQALRAGPPPALPDHVPPELRAICERAMARDPAARYAGMVELADDLRAFLEVRTVRAYATGRFAELHKWVARNRMLAAMAGALVVLLAVGSVLVTLLWVQAETDRGRADASAASLQTELDRSTFQRARQALQLDNSTQAADTLWRAHFRGRMPRATGWALKELAERDPYLVALPEREDLPLAFTVAGDLVLVGGSDGRLQLREPRTLAIVAAIGVEGPRLTALAVLDAARVVTGNANGELLVVDLAARAVVQRRREHDGAVTCLAVVPAAGFVSAGNDGRVLRWQQLDTAPQVLHAGKARLATLAVRPNGDGVVFGDDAGALTGVAFDGSWRFTRPRLAPRITALAFADGPGRMWVGDTDQQVRFVDLDDAAAQWVRWTRNGTCRQLARARDGSVFVGGWWRTDRMAADGTTVAPVALRPISRMAVAPDQRWLVTTSTRSGLGVVDLEPIGSRRLPAGGAVSLSGDGRFVATSSGNHATMHDVVTGAVVHELPKGSSGWLALDREGRHLASTRLQPGSVRVYEVATGRLLYTAPGPTNGSGFATRFSPAGDELAFAVGNDLLRRVRTVDGSLVAEYPLPGARIVALAYSADGSALAVAARGRTAVRVYELATGHFRDEDFAAHWPENVPGTLSAVALAPDGRALAVGNSNGPILVRNGDGTTLALPGHAGTVWSVQFAGNDPGLLFSSGGAQGIAAWDLDSGECCYQAVRDQASQLQVSDDGATLCCFTPAGAVLLDLAYHERHIAGNLPLHLDGLRTGDGLSDVREVALRAWAAEVMARPWPRWR